nr:MAG TPA: tail assembly chaperone protein [Caudoviricetes sp.]
MPRVTVVPADRLIIVDGEALYFDFQAPANLHALQWDGEQGHMEWTDDYNMMLDASLYNDEVAPFVALWEAEKARLAAEAASAETARLAEYNSDPARYARLRTERDRRVAATDYLVMPDYPLGDDAKAAVSAYRQALRDLPQQAGAPWDGGGEDTPWPDQPAVLTDKAVA